MAGVAAKRRVNDEWTFVAGTDGTQKCRLSPDAFFGGRSEERAAKALCRECPFLRKCLAEAMQDDIPGVWGGTTQAERKKMKGRVRYER